MKTYVQFGLDQGGSIVVEVDEPISSGAERAGRREKVEEAKQSFNQALDTIRPAAITVLQKVKEFAGEEAPDGVEVEFGIKLSAEFGAVLASASVEANYRVTLKWEPHRAGA